MSVQNRKFDVIVIGAGPAGSSAAYTLATNGINVCLPDKSVFPRDKLCGGLLSLRTKKIFTRIFGATWDSTIEVISRGISFYHKDRYLNSAENCKDLSFTQRFVFDTYLMDLAKKKGACVFPGTPVKSIDKSQNAVVLSNGLPIYADCIIGADGINSIVAKSLYSQSFFRSALGFALEMEIPVNNKYQRIENPEIYFGVIKWGVKKFIFPKGS